MAVILMHCILLAGYRRDTLAGGCSKESHGQYHTGPGRYNQSVLAAVEISINYINKKSFDLTRLNSF